MMWTSLSDQIRGSWPLLKPQGLSRQYPYGGRGLSRQYPYGGRGLSRQYPYGGWGLSRVANFGTWDQWRIKKNGPIRIVNGGEGGQLSIHAAVRLY